jgi:hypothetical protein
MPKLNNCGLKRSFAVTSKFTEQEYAVILAAAERLRMKPSAFVRQAVIASTKLNASERLLLAKTCKLEAMMQLLFGGLFAQLNDNKPFERDHFRQALETAEAVQFRKADEHVLKHAASTGEVFHG